MVAVSQKTNDDCGTAKTPVAVRSVGNLTRSVVNTHSTQIGTGALFERCPFCQIRYVVESGAMALETSLAPWMNEAVAAVKI